MLKIVRRVICADRRPLKSPSQSPNLGDWLGEIAKLPRLLCFLGEKVRILTQKVQFRQLFCTRISLFSPGGCNDCAPSQGQRVGRRFLLKTG